MGCFPILKSKKKQPKKVIRKYASFNENLSTKLPEPESHGAPLKSAPASFNMRGKPIQPTTLSVCNGDYILAHDFAEKKIFNGDAWVGADRWSPTPQSLPLPTPPKISSPRNPGSFNSSNSSDATFSGPLPLPPSRKLKSFSFEEISEGCKNFAVDLYLPQGHASIVYKVPFQNETLSKKSEATVNRVRPSDQGLKDFVKEANVLASLQHPQLCKLLGFCASEEEEINQRFLVYEKLHYGTLDELLHERYEGPILDWGARMKIALCAAKGLAFLHEEGPSQAMYSKFSAKNIQIDKDFSAKISGYGFASCTCCQEDLSTTNMSDVSLEKSGGFLTPKSIVWDFGIVLLELISGRKNVIDHNLSRDQHNLVQWSKAYLSEDCRLTLIMDSRLQGRFPPKAARTIADIISKCVRQEPSERPTMRAIVEALKNVQDMRYSCRFRLQAP